MKSPARRRPLVPSALAATLVIAASAMLMACASVLTGSSRSVRTQAAISPRAAPTIYNAIVQAAVRYLGCAASEIRGSVPSACGDRTSR